MSKVKEAALRLQLMDGVSGPARAISATLKALDGAVARFNARREMANAAFQGAIFQAAAFGAALTVPIRAAARLEDAMADVRKVSGFSGEALAGLRKEIIQVSRETPMAAEEIAGLSAELAAAGVHDSELLSMTKLVARAGTAFGITGQQAGESLGKIKSALGFSVAKTEQFADQVNALSDATASSAADLIDFTRRVGPLGKQFGFTTEQVLAYGSAMISAGATAETAATGFQAVGRALVKGEAATSGQSKAYKRLGLTARGVAKGMAKDALATTEDVFARIRQLPQDERASVVNQLFGDEAKTALALIENTDLLGTSLKVLADQGRITGSVMREFQTRIGTTSGKTGILRNRVMAAGIAFGNSLLQAVGDAADALGPLVDRASNFIETNEAMVARLTKVAAGMVAMRVAATGARAGLYALLRPSNLLIAGIGYLAYQNFDALSGAARDLITVGRELAGTAFVRGFSRGAAEGIEGMAAAVRSLAKAAAELTGKGTALRDWLDSVGGAGTGEMLGKIAVGLGAVAASAALLGPILRPLRSMVRLVGSLGQAAAGVRGTAAALESVNAAAAKAGSIPRPGLWSTLLAGWNMGELIADLPTDKKGLEEVIAANRKRSEGWNGWLERNIGSPRSWLGLDQGERRTPDTKATKKQLDSITEDWPAAARRALLSYGNTLAAGGPQAEAEAAAIGDRVQAALSVEGRPTVNTAELEQALGLARQLAAAVRGASGSYGADIPNGNRFGGPRAKGGPVESGRSYLVGERGPEIFSPSRSGKIMPNHEISRSVPPQPGGGSVVFNNNFTFHGASQDQAMAAVRTIDRQLRRLPQIAFGSAKTYGD